MLKKATQYVAVKPQVPKFYIQQIASSFLLFKLLGAPYFYDKNRNNFGSNSQ